MGLISKEVEINIVGRNYKHYEELGYHIPRVKNKQGKMVIPTGAKIVVKVEDLTKGSKTIVECMCDRCGFTTYMTYSNYCRFKKNDNKYYCHQCNNILFGRHKRIRTIIKKSKSFKEWCIENNKQDILDRWDYELNKCNPEEVCCNSRNKCWFKCNKYSDHEGELKRIDALTRNNNCKIICTQCNSIAQWFIDNGLNINDYWDWDKNAISPWEISYRNPKEIWMKCQEKDYHGSYEIAPFEFINGEKCTYCAKKKIHPKDSLGQYICDNYGEEFLNKIWSDNNEKTSFEYAPNSRKKVWWKCENDKHEEYFRSIQKSNRFEFRCPKCRNESKESVIEE